MQTQQLLEDKIKALRATMSAEQWADAAYLLTCVKGLEQADKPFAFRLMQRTKNLAPTKANSKLLEKLTAQALAQHPELATIGSTSSPEQEPAIIRLKRLVKAALGVVGNSKLKKIKYPFLYFIIFPFLLFAFYQILLASPRYESQAQLIVKEPNGMATLDPAMAIMSGFGISSGDADTQLVQSYIHSNDMLIYLDSELNLIQHYSDTELDFFSRLSSNSSRESQLEFFLSMVNIVIDEKSQVIIVKAQAFDPTVAHKLSQILVERAEWYINEVGRNLAKSQLDFVQQEHKLVQEKLSAAKSVLLGFQRRFDLLDPEAEGMALQQISYQLESLITAKKTELIALGNSMTDQAPMILQAKAELDSLVEQLNNERNRLTDKIGSDTTNDSESSSMGVGEILAKYSDYKINLELALQGYTSSLVSLEKSRIEAYRQLKYLVVVESPTLPQDASYPKVFYNLVLFLTLALMLFGGTKIILATVDELR
jgi:capsular polysaccharide transport system permease protein